MNGMPPTVGFNMPLGSIEPVLKSVGDSINKVSGLALSKEKANKKAKKKSGQSSPAGNGNANTFIPLTAGGGLPIHLGNRPRPVQRNGGDSKSTGGTGKFEPNPLYGKWKHGMRTFKGDLAEQRIVQNQVQPDVGPHKIFTNDLYPDTPIARNSLVMTPSERIPGKPTRDAPYNRTAARNISARQNDALKLNKTIAKVRRTNAAK